MVWKPLKFTILLISNKSINYGAKINNKIQIDEWTLYIFVRNMKMDYILMHN